MVWHRARDYRAEMRHLSLTIVLSCIAAASGLALSGCGKSGGAGHTSGGSASTTAPLALGTTGFVVDAPEGWTVKSPMDGFFTVKGDHQSVQLDVSHMSAPSSADELAEQTCTGQSDVVKEPLKSGGFFVQCKGPARGVQVEGKAITTTKIESVVPAGDGTTMSCRYETDRDPAVIASICRSLRKKS